MPDHPPRFLGSLHDRMALVMHLMQRQAKADGGRLTSTPLWHAVWDLRTIVDRVPDVAFHTETGALVPADHRHAKRGTAVAAADPPPSEEAGPYPPVPERWRHEAAGALAPPPPLALFLLDRTDQVSYDQHDAAVVRAADEAEARRLVADLSPTAVWGAAAGVACTRLGAAVGGDAAIVLASFHAG